MKKKSNRDESSYEVAAKVLQTLNASTTQKEVDDNAIIRKNLDMILELKNNGVGYEMIYNALNKELSFKISFKTFKAYVQRCREEKGLVTKRPRDSKTKNIRILIPSVYEKEVHELVTHLNKNERDIIAAGRIDGQANEVAWTIKFNRQVA
jgi:hypothetical protein